MSQQNPEEQSKESRIQHLEKLREWFVNALEIGASLGDIQGSINQNVDPVSIMAATRLRLEQLMHFDALAFMTVDEETQDFSIVDCGPPDQKDNLQAEIDIQIENGTFAWALSQTRTILEHSRDGKPLVLHAVATRSRIMGMFVGLLSDDMANIRGASLNMLSMILLSTANALQSHQLYRIVNEQNQTLEQKIAQRTGQLQIANVKAKAANLAKSQFLANMSHEIRTPLTAIIGYAEMLQESKLDDTRRTSAISTINRTGKHLLGIINDILDLSKIESEKLEIEIIPCEFFKLLEEIRSVVTLQVQDKDLEFILDFNFPLPITIHTDPTRLKQILFNLCNNAIKFTEQGSVCIDINWDRDHDMLMFSVKDTGIGLSKDQVDRLFQRFSQADATTTRRFGGSGLGLYISKQLAEKLGGTITVESKVDHGSTFCVTVSSGYMDLDGVADNPDEVPALMQAKTFDDLEPLRLNGRVLLAEDNVDNQGLIAHYIEQLGAQVSIVDNGRSAVELALSKPFDLVLMDMQMPIMGGLEATSKLREQGYEGPIVALTANAMKESRQQCEDAGHNGFLTKPIELKEFQKTLSEYLEEDDSVETKQAASKKSVEAALQLIKDKFLDGLPERMKIITRSATLHEWAVVQSEAHKLKGIGGSVGYPELSQIAETIESAAKEQNIQKASDSVSDLTVICVQALQNNTNKLQ